MEKPRIDLLMTKRPGERPCGDCRGNGTDGTGSQTAGANTSQRR